MKLGTLKNSTRDGELVVIRQDNTRFAKASHISPHLRAALENWSQAEAPLKSLYNQVNRNEIETFRSKKSNSTPLFLGLFSGWTALPISNTLSL